MTSKTFKSPLPDSSYKFEIGKNVGAEHLFAWISGGGVDSISMALAPSDAPALALAILEAAGVVPVQRDYESYDDGTPAHLQTVAYFLKQHNEAQERSTAEARELAELEAEALELVNGYRTSMGDPTVASFDGFSAQRVTGWLAVARRARELAKEATK